MHTEPASCNPALPQNLPGETQPARTASPPCMKLANQGTQTSNTLWCQNPQPWANRASAALGLACACANAARACRCMPLNSIAWPILRPLCSRPPQHTALRGREQSHAALLKMPCTATRISACTQASWLVVPSARTPASSEQPRSLVSGDARVLLWQTTGAFTGGGPCGSNVHPRQRLQKRAQPCAYRRVHSAAVLSCASLSVSSCCAMLPTSGSSACTHSSAYYASVHGHRTCSMPANFMSCKAPYALIF